MLNSVTVVEFLQVQPFLIYSICMSCFCIIFHANSMEVKLVTFSCLRELCSS